MSHRLPFEYQIENDGVRATAWGGLPVVAEALDVLGVTAALEEEVKFGGRRMFNSVEIVKTLVLTMTMGGECVDDVAALRSDRALQELLAMTIPAPETVRQALDLFHDEALVEHARRQAVREKKKAYVPQESRLLKGLARATAALLREAQKRSPADVATLDIDATIQESHKREAKTHYLNGLGYQPLIAVWAEKDLVVADEFRDGNVPAHFDALHVAQRAFAALPEGIRTRQCRADSQMYNTEALKWLVEEDIGFAIGIIKREGFDEACKATNESAWSHLDTRSDSELHVTQLEYAPERMRHVKGIRYLAVRLTPVQDDLLERGRATRYLGIVTNRPGDAAELVRWYWDKAGTVEHVHDVMKNDLGGAVLPSGKFGANAAWYRICALTYNVLSVLRGLGPEHLRNAKPKRLRLHVFALPAILASHARRLVARASDFLVAAVNAPLLRAALHTAGP
jgi:hypothetical protein